MYSYQYDSLSLLTVVLCSWLLPYWGHKYLQHVLERMWRKGNPLTLLVGMQVVQPLWKTVWRFLRKLKIELPYDPAIALLGIYPKDTEVVNRRAICTPMFMAAMTTVAKLLKEPRCLQQVNG